MLQFDCYPPPPPSQRYITIAECFGARFLVINEDEGHKIQRHFDLTVRRFNVLQRSTPNHPMLVGSFELYDDSRHIDTESQALSRKPRTNSPPQVVSDGPFHEIMLTPHQDIVRRARGLTLFKDGNLCGLGTMKNVLDFSVCPSKREPNEIDVLCVVYRDRRLEVMEIGQSCEMVRTLPTSELGDIEAKFCVSDGQTTFLIDIEDRLFVEQEDKFELHEEVGCVLEVGPVCVTNHDWRMVVVGNTRTLDSPTLFDTNLSWIAKCSSVSTLYNVKSVN